MATCRAGLARSSPSTTRCSPATYLYLLKVILLSSQAKILLYIIILLLYRELNIVAVDMIMMSTIISIFSKLG